MANTPEVCPRVATEQERRWLEKNREAIEAYNRRVAQDGLLSDHTGLHDDPS
jgi:post-segregation antitoxin (ccd killing protein)